jgi:hypothetical protein
MLALGERSENNLPDHAGQHTRSSRIRQERFCKIYDPECARPLMIPCCENDILRRPRTKPRWNPT